MEKFDAIDLKILEVLQTQSNLTNIKLAAIVGLSPSPCLQRVRRLRKAGYIRDFAARVNTAKLFPSITAYTKIRLSEQTVRQFSTFENAIMKVPEILECCLTSGEFDYFLKVVSRDLDHFHEIIKMMMEMDIGIKNYSMFVEVRNVKSSTSIPLTSLMKHP